MIDYGEFDAAIGLNWYEVDPALQARVADVCPPEDLGWATDKLTSLGELIGGRVARNADIIDANPPRLVAYDRWANDANRIEHHPAALDSKRALWEVGYVSGFAEDEASRGRPVPGAVLAASSYLLSEADTGMVCSLGMTTGVAELVDAYAPPDLRAELLAGLRSHDFEHGIDGSMFLTEREGGSDLGATVHCVARDIGDGRVLIDGEKWFCSNIDGAAIVMLARPEGAPDGPAGLGLYLVPRVRDDETPNSFRMRRLKEKLGTRSVPTGEVVFEGALGYALRPRDRGPTNSDAGGLNRMMEMVNGSRFGVALMSLGIARRCFLESAIWAHQRQAKGRLLVDLPLVREQLVGLVTEVEAYLALAFECVALSKRSDGMLGRRILVPAIKVRAGRLGLEAASLAVELYGGNGYCEDWGLTRQLRDAQCHPIWEGSENICQLDVLRAIRRHGAHLAAFKRISEALTVARGGVSAMPWLNEAVTATAEAANELESLTGLLMSREPDRAQAMVAPLTALLVDVTVTALLAEDATQHGDRRKGLLALRYARRHLRTRPAWDDAVAAVAGRPILSYAEVDPEMAAAAAA